MTQKVKKMTYALSVGLFVLVLCLRTVRTFCRAADMFYDPHGGKQSRRGQEHLVDFERSEEIYLVIRDARNKSQKTSGIARGFL